MGINHRARTGRRPTGGRYTLRRSKRSHQMGRLPSNTTVADANKVKTVRTIGGGQKTKAMKVAKVNLYDSKTKKYQAAKVTGVAENNANRHFVRQNVITKGAVIETEKGQARVTSRPGQDGTVNAVLL